MKCIKTLGFLLLTLLPGTIFSQGSNSVEMADTLHANGKIYVVVLRLIIILTGVIAFLIIVDRKLHNVEKRMKNLPQSPRDSETH
jgi:hypothetical protein